MDYYEDLSETDKIWLYLCLNSCCDSTCNLCSSRSGAFCVFALLITAAWAVVIWQLSIHEW